MNNLTNSIYVVRNRLGHAFLRNRSSLSVWNVSVHVYYYMLILSLLPRAVYFGDNKTSEAFQGVHIAYTVNTRIAYHPCSCLFVLVCAWLILTSIVGVFFLLNMFNDCRCLLLSANGNADTKTFLFNEGCSLVTVFDVLGSFLRYMWSLVRYMKPRTVYST